MPRVLIFSGVLFSGFIIFALIGAASAQQSPPAASVIAASWVGGSQVQARLLPAPPAAGKTGPQAALQIKLSPGWHTYWRVPGDAGLPPRLDWSGSENFQQAEILWPVPERLEEAEDLSVFAYRDEVVFPLRLALQDSDRPAILKLKLEIMACKDICIPETLMLGADTAAPAAEASSLLARAQKTVPGAGRGALKIQTAVLAPGALVVALSAEKPLPGDVRVFAYADDLAFTRKPGITIDERNPGQALVRLEAGDSQGDLGRLLAGKKLHVTAFAAGEAVEKEFQF